MVLVALTGALAFGFFGFVKPAEAGVGTGLLGVATAGLAAWGITAGVGAISDIINSFDTLMIRLLAFFAKLLGKLFTWVVGMLVQVAGYNDFLKATAVVTGWVIVRDLANMFFVLILLVISIATILRVEAYSYKKLLPKLLLMAVLINFSKTICGIIIDFSQVIMLTFVNAFQAAAGANFFQALGVHQMFDLDNLAGEAGAPDQQWDLVGTAFLALLVVLIATITVGVLMVVLVARIVVLWTLIVLSPLAFLLASFPQGQTYAKQWWDEFSKYVISGPVLAFFIWLALIVAGGGTASTEIGVDSTALDTANGLGAVGKYNNLSSLVVGVTMLLVGLMFTQKLGVVGSSVAGAALSGLRRAGTAPFRTALRGAKGGVGLAWKGTKALTAGGYQRGADMMYGATGVALPGSKMRSELKEERKKTLHRDRLYRGQTASADRVSGKRLGVQMAFAALMDPGLARKMGTLDMLKMLPKRDTSESSIKRFAELQKQKATFERFKEDPVGRFQEDVKSELKTEKDLSKAADGQALKKGKEAKELEKEMSDEQKAGVGKVLQLNAERVNLESQVAQFDTDLRESRGEEKKWGDEATSLAEQITETKETIKVTPEGTPERATLDAASARLQTRHTEATEKRDQAAGSVREKERLKTESQNNLSNVGQQIAGVKVDVRMEKLIEIRGKIEQYRKTSSEHQDKATNSNDLLKKWVTMSDSEKSGEARKRLDKLFKNQSLTNSALSTLTPQLQATIKKAFDRTKDLLARQLGREPTEEEIGRELGATA